MTTTLSNVLVIPPEAMTTAVLESSRGTQRRIPRAGSGGCNDCTCPQYSGSVGYTCTRGGCNHHYDRHW